MSFGMYWFYGRSDRDTGEIGWCHRMYKNQLQELAQRSCFNLPSYACIREGPDHEPRFKAKVNFNGEVFGSPSFCSTLRQAEHAAAEVALKTLSTRGPSRALAAKVLDETGVYKNLLQETAHRAGLKLPVYTTVRSGSGHVPVFTCTVELGGMSFSGEPARTKKQAQKSVAMTAWFALKKMSQSGSSSSSSYPLSEFGAKDEQEQVIVARYLASLLSADSNKMIPRDRCHEPLELAPRRRDVISYQSGRSFYPMQCQSFACSHFLPELAMYQAQPQERMSEQQGCLLAFPSAPTSVPGPQFFPFVRSIIRPDHGPQFLASWQEQFPLGPRISPFFYFSDSAMPIPVRRVSQVSIKEIDDNTQVEDKWLSNEANSSGWKLNFPSNASGLSPTEVLNYGDSLNTHSRLRIQELLQGEHEKKNSECTPDSRNSSQKDIYRKEGFHWIPPGFIQNRPRAMGADEGRFCPQNPNSSSFVCSNARPRDPPMDSSPRLARGFAPPLSAAPVAIRSRNAGAISLGSTRAEAPRPLFSARTPTSTSVAVGLTRPWVEGAKNIRGMPCASSMAPAVQIRTVVPVCSSPPARKMPGPSQEGIFSRGGRKMTEERGDISAASSEFSSLKYE